MKKLKDYLVANKVTFDICIFFVVSLLSTVTIAAGIMTIYFTLCVIYQAITGYQKGTRKHISAVEWKNFYSVLSIKISIIIIFTLSVFIKSEWKWPLIALSVIVIILSFKSVNSNEEDI